MDEQDIVDTDTISRHTYYESDVPCVTLNTTFAKLIHRVLSLEKQVKEL